MLQNDGAKTLAVMHTGIAFDLTGTSFLLFIMLSVWWVVNTK